MKTFPFMYTTFGGRMGHKRSKRNRTKTTTETKPEQNETTTITTSKGVYPRSRPVVASSGSSPRLSGSRRRWARGQVCRLRLFSLRAAWRRRWKGAPFHSGTSSGFGLCRGFGGDRRGMSIKERVVDEDFASTHKELDGHLQHPQRTSSFF